MILQTGGTAFGAILTRSKVLLLGKRQGVGRGHNTKLAAVSSDHAKLLVADLLVDLMF